MSLAGLSAYGSSSSEEEPETNDTHVNETHCNKGIKSVKSGSKVKIMAINKKAVESSDSDDDQPPIKKLASCNPSETRCGLFSKLPAPRNTIGNGKTTNRPLIPHVFRKKTEDTKKPMKKLPLKTSTVIANSEDNNNSPDEDEGDVNFFSFVDKAPIPEVIQQNRNIASADNNMAQSSHFQSQTYVKSPQNPSPSVNYAQDWYTQDATQTFAEENRNVHADNSFNASSVNQIPIASTRSSDLSWIEDDKLLRLQGKKNRKEKIEFIEVNADTALEGNQELLLKSISEEKNKNRISHSKKKNENMPTSQQKRKHQLSYLIHQARSQELELKESWAAGREKRDAARMRYGF